MPGRYDAIGIESEFEPGSRNRVLRNLLGIRSTRAMADAESDALLVTQVHLVGHYSADHRFVAADIRAMHHDWLGSIYAWAGEYRNVNIVKGDFPFAAATQVPRLMHAFESRELAVYTPCRHTEPDEVARALAVVHAELVLIHPFREGNGRCARLLSLLMALQTGLPPLDFGVLSGRGKLAYIEAIHSAMSSDYEPMTRLFKTVIARTVRRHRVRPPTEPGQRRKPAL